MCGRRALGGWSGARQYLDEVNRRAKLSNVLSLTGHGSLRIAHMGLRQGIPEAKEMDAMERNLSECLADGSAGLSTGLMYAPGSSASHDELLRLCKVVERHGKVYATHMRSYSHQLLESLQEQIALARESGCRLQISHLQAVGRANWEKQDRALELLEEALNTFPYDLQLPWLMGRFLMERDRFAEAIPFFERLAQAGETGLFSRHASYDMRMLGVLAYENLATCHFRLHGWKEAARYYDLALAKEPRRMDLRAKRSVAHSKMGSSVGK